MHSLLQKEWFDALNDEMKVYFKGLCEIIDLQYQAKPDKIFPPKCDVFSAFNLTSKANVKVVILGQDPYPTKSFANGLCFSVSPLSPIPKSLKNIYTELKSDIGKEIPVNGDLSAWSKQGVLLLNTVLTVEEGKPDSHSKIGWEKFTDAIIELISTESQHLVFMLWGAKAQQKIPLIDQSKHLILTAPHPSPLSVYRGFYGCQHFSKANQYLKVVGKKPIVW